MPSALSLAALASRAQGAGPVYQDVSVVAPNIMPQVINIFLYGGASELAGNLTNIDYINANSQTPYTRAFGNNILQTTAQGGQITPHGFWRDAGGDFMQQMLASGDLSVYRTLMKRKNTTRSHRESIFMSHKGALDVENSPGIGTRLAALLHSRQERYNGRTRLADGRLVEDVLALELPFVSFEGESTSYAIDPDYTDFPLRYRAITLSDNFDNPYARRNEIAYEAALYDRMLTWLSSDYNRRYQKAVDAFSFRDNMDALFSTVIDDAANQTLPDDPDNPGTALVYPNNNRYTDRIRAAVILALHNPSTLYITIGEGLGGWDDHNNAVDRYRNRMRDLMEVMQVATKHLRAYHNSLPIASGATRATDNIVFNVFGDFGRLVNLNNSGGWDHANNQNLYTFGGAGVRATGALALGKVVGTTRVAGTPGTNNQYTVPTDDSYEIEPMSVAASVYQYFGAQNPEVMTRDPVFNPTGDAAIDETQTGIAPLF